MAGPIDRSKVMEFKGIPEDTIFLVNGQIYGPQNKVTTLPTNSATTNSTSDLELKIWQGLDNIFDTHANDRGVSRNAYQDSIEYLRDLTDANFARVILLKRDINTGIVPTDLKEYVDTREEFFAVKSGQEDTFSFLKNEGQLYNIATGVPTNDITEDDITKEGFKGVYELKLKEDSDALAILELYGIQNNNQTKKVISTFKDVMDTKIHRDITSAQNLIDIITKEELTKQEVIDSLLEGISAMTGQRITINDLSKIKEQKIEIGTTEQAKEERRDISGHYYTNDSFFKQYKGVFDDLLDHPSEIKDLKGIALEFLDLPDYSMFYNRKKSNEFISEAELAEKLSKLVMAATLVKAFGRDKLNKNPSNEQIENALLKNPKIYTEIIGNGMLGLYSIFSKRAKSRNMEGEVILLNPNLENSYNNLEIFSALNKLWFDESAKGKINSHFIYNEGNIYQKKHKSEIDYRSELNDLREQRRNLMLKQKEITKRNEKLMILDKKEVEELNKINKDLSELEKKVILPYQLVKTREEFVPLVNHMKMILPRINDSPERKEAKQSDALTADTDLIEAATIFMNYNQRTPYFTPGYEAEGPKPHTIRESLQFLKALGYEYEAGLIAHAVYFPFPFKNK